MAFNSSLPPLNPPNGRFQAITRIFVPFFIKNNAAKIFEKGTNFSKMLESAQKASSGVPILAEIAASGGTRFKKTPENAQPEEGPDTRFLRLK